MSTPKSIAPSKQNGDTTVDSEVRDADDRIFQISNLQIMMDVNGLAKSEPFDLDMLYHPELEEDKPITTSKTPYFTRDALFPGFNLMFRSMKDRVEFFFNIDVFKRTMLLEGTNWIDREKEDGDSDTASKEAADNTANPTISLVEYTPLSKEEEANERANVMTLLRCLFSISNKFDKPISSTFEHYIKGKWNPEILYGTDVIESLNVFGFMEKFGITKKDRGVSYLKIGGKNRIIMNTVWEDDIINHPVYRKFILAYYKQLSQSKPAKRKVANNFNVGNNKLYAQLVKNTYISSLKKLLVSEIDKYIQSNGMSYAALFNVSSRQQANSESIEWIMANMSDNKLREVIDKVFSDANKIERLNGEMSGINKTIVDIPNTKSYKVNSFDKNTIFSTLKNKECIRVVLSYLNSNISNDSRNFTKDSAIRNITIKFEQISDTVYAQNDMVRAANDIGLISNAISEYEKTLKTTFELGDFDKMIKSEYLNLAVDIIAANRVLDFIEKNIIIRIANNGVYFDGTKETELDKLVISRIHKLYEDVLNTSKELGTTLFDVVRPKRITSNPNLYYLLNRIQMGRWPETDDEELQKQYDREKNMLVFIHNKYFSRYPPNIRNRQETPYMCTGVDTVISNNKRENNSVSEMLEIYVRFTVIDHSKFMEDGHAECKIQNDFLANELHYLLDVNSIALVNPFREFRLIDDITTNGLTTIKEPSKTRGGFSNNKRKTYSKRIRSRRITR
jgi:hypothetical protein